MSGSNHQPPHEHEHPGATVDRWDAARRLMAGEITPDEYRELEPSYQTDYAGAMLDLARKQRARESVPAPTLVQADVRDALATAKTLGEVAIVEVGAGSRDYGNVGMYLCLEGAQS